MPSVPAYYEPLTAEEREQFLKLFERACGVPIQKPSAVENEKQTPARWLFEVWHASQKHVGLMSTTRPGNVDDFFYCPRSKKFIHAITGQVFP